MAAPLPTGLRQRYERAIVRFVAYCRVRRSPRLAGAIRAFLADGNAADKPALRWFYCAARGEPGPICRDATARTCV